MRRLALALALLPLGGCLFCNSDNYACNARQAEIWRGFTPNMAAGYPAYSAPAYPYIAPPLHYSRPSSCYANDLGGGTVALNCY